MSIHYTTVTITLSLPRPLRETIARVTDGLARRGNGMSKHAASAVEKLLSPCDLVELTYLEAVSITAQCQGEDNRIERARERGELTARQQSTAAAIKLMLAQAEPQTRAAIGQIRMGEPLGYRPPRKIGLHRAE